MLAAKRKLASRLGRKSRFVLQTSLAPSARRKRRPRRETKNPSLPFLLQPFSCAGPIPTSAYWTITLFRKNDHESFLTLPFLKKDFLESTLGKRNKKEQKGRTAVRVSFFSFFSIFFLSFRCGEEKNILCYIPLQNRSNEEQKQVSGVTCSRGEESPLKKKRKNEKRK